MVPFYKGLLLCVHSKSILTILRIKRCKITIFRVIHRGDEPSFKIKNLQGQSVQQKFGKRALQSASFAGSMTVEAALVFPLFLFAVYAVVMLSQLLLSNSEVERALDETVRYMAKAEYGQVEKEDEEETQESLLSKCSYNIKFHQYIDESRLGLVEKGGAGVKLHRVQQSGWEDYVILTAQFQCKVPIPLFGNFCFSMEETAVQRIFSGYDLEKGWKNDNYVYVAEHGKVYHTHPDCSYITVRVIPSRERKELSGMRNCRLCCKKGKQGEYVTVCGDCVHWDSNCSALTRTVHLVKKTELGGLPLCGRCRER